MKLLYLTYYFPPEIGSGPHLPYELGESFVRKGHEVTIVTGFPHYHVPVMPPQYRRNFFYVEEMGGMKVLRINILNPYTSHKVVRGLAQQISPWMLAIRAMGAEKPDLVYTQTPPLVMGLAACRVAKHFKVPCVVNVQDLFPQAAVDLGLMHNRALIRFFEILEHRLYRKADVITVMSDGNGDYVAAHGASRDRVRTVPNWVDTDLIQPSEKMNAFRAEHQLGDQFIVLFAGTMGWSQGLEVVVEAARLLTAEPNLLFLFVGEGMELADLRRRSDGLPNVRFLPMQTKTVYPRVLAAADVALVTLRPEVATPTVPSKISTIMAAGRPILASIPLEGDAPRLIQEAEAGIVVPAGDARALADAVLAVRNNPQQSRRMGQCGRSYAERVLSRNVCVDQNEAIFRSLIHC